MLFLQYFPKIRHAHNGDILECSERKKMFVSCHKMIRLSFYGAFENPKVGIIRPAWDGIQVFLTSQANERTVEKGFSKGGLLKKHRKSVDT